MRPRFDQATWNVLRALSVTACALLTLCGCEGKPVEGGEAPRIPPTLADRFYPPTSWAWGKLSVEGAPTLRYGVGVPDRSARGEVLILPDAGEPAEVWFETANDLMDRGYDVWALDLPGQGGSGRWVGSEDRLFAKSLDPDVAAVGQMVATVIRPKARGPLFVIGDGLGAQVALRALEGGRPDVAGAVLGSPALGARSTRLYPPFGDWGADLAGRVGFGRPFVEGEHGWKEPDRIAKDRTGLRDAWFKTNPGLRVGGASLAWTAAYNRSAAAARAPAPLARLTAPLLLMADARDAAARRACSSMKNCRFVVSPGGTPHLAPDPARRAWLDEAGRFMAAHSLGHSIAAPPQP